jgi:F-type H+-transporting ATPase subunit a
MKTRDKLIVSIVVILVLLVVGNVLLRFHLPPVTVRPEALPGVFVGGVQLTNTLITALLVDIILIVLAILGTRNMQLVPRGFQNLLELAVEAIYNLTESVAGAKWTPRFFAIVATIFFYILISNWFGLIPGLAAFGVCEEHPVGEAVQPTVGPGLAAPLMDLSQEETSPAIGCQAGEVLVPLFRSPSTDLNNNLALAIISVFMTQVFGVMATGVGYFTRFFNVKGMIQAFQPDRHGNRRGCAGALSTFRVYQLLRRGPGDGQRVCQDHLFLLSSLRQHLRWGGNAIGLGLSGTFGAEYSFPGVGGLRRSHPGLYLLYFNCSLFLRCHSFARS